MRVRRWIFILAAAACGLVAGNGIAADSPEEAYKKGRAAFDAGDIVGAMPLLRSAADRGHAQAQATFGYLLDSSDYDEEAAKYYRMAADQGDADGQFGLASLHMNGSGGLPVDTKKIFELLEKSARGGHQQAAVTLSTAYIGGGLGLKEPEKSSPAALEWIRKAADFGDIVALEALRNAYRDGRYGLAANPEAAAELDKKLATAKGIKIDDSSKKKRRSKL